MLKAGIGDHLRLKPSPPSKPPAAGRRIAARSDAADSLRHRASPTSFGIERPPSGVRVSASTASSHALRMHARRFLIQRRFDHALMRWTTSWEDGRRFWREKRIGFPVKNAFSFGKRLFRQRETSFIVRNRAIYSNDRSKGRSPRLFGIPASCSLLSFIAALRCAIASSQSCHRRHLPLVRRLCA